ncbi:MAG: HD-GYP domain-containing protein [Bacillota bacterium]
MADRITRLTEKLKKISLAEPENSYTKLASFLVSTDSMVGIHSIRVSGYAVVTGSEMGLPESKLKVIFISALLHDIGKMLVPSAILRKSSALSRLEMDIVKHHPELGKRILQGIDRYNPYAGYVLHHHEYFNGRGYPDGLSGLEIPEISRIIAVADAYEALTSDRPYRKGISHREAVTRLKMARNTQLDPEITGYFLKAIKSFSKNEAWNSEFKMELWFPDA